jgi:hypothetical protein
LTEAAHPRFRIFKEKAMANSNAKPGDAVELKDKEGGFSDWETGFDISRSQVKKLGDRIGERTHQAIASGGLVIVTGSRAKKAGSGEDDEGSKSPPDGSDIPEDLPGRQAFIDAGLSFAQVQALETPEQLMEIKGVGEKTVKDLMAWAKKNRK